MSAHAIASEMRAELRRYRNSTRVGGPEECLQAKDDLIHSLDGHLARLMRAIGTVERQSFGTSGVSGKGKPFVVARRGRKMVVRAA